MKASALHLLLSDTNPKLAFHLASSLSQTAIPEGVFYVFIYFIADIKIEGFDPNGFNSDESVAKLQPELKVKRGDS